MQRRRHEIWNLYAERLAPWAHDVGATTMVVPDGCDHPAHVFYVLMPSPRAQAGLMAHTGAREVSSVFHYQPLDSSPGGMRLGLTPRPCHTAHDVAGRIVRLPLHPGLTDSDVERVIDAVSSYRPVP
jgi:dTDP-4-amino-4,6-dideoxygalactose transaminase